MTVTRYLFDAGPEGTQLTAANTGLSSFIRDQPSTQVFAASAARSGPFGALFTSTNTGSLGRVAVDPNLVQALSFGVKLPAILPPSGVLTFWTPRDTAAAAVGRMAWLDDNTMRFLDKSNAIKYFYTTAGGTTKATFQPSTFYRVEARLAAGASTTTGTFTISVYNAAGTLVGVASSTTANLGTVQIASHDIGLGAGGGTSEMSLGVDEIQVEPGRTSEIGAYVPGTNSLPAVTATSPQTTTTPNATVTLNSTATDSDGTITSRKWDFQSTPLGVAAPSITNSTAATATFVPTIAGIYVARHTVTDNAGGTSSATVTIYVGGTSVSVIGVTGNPGAWVPVPAANGLTAVLSDTDSTTYAESPTSPPTAAALRMRLAPLQPLTTLTLALTGLAQSGAGNLVNTVELFDGSTSRKKWTVAQGGDVTLALTAAETATITNWNTLDVEISTVAA